MIKPSDFADVFKDQIYGQKLFEYSLHIERVKVVHAFSLSALAVYVVAIAAPHGGLSVNGHHYK